MSRHNSRAPIRSAKSRTKKTAKAKRPTTKPLVSTSEHVKKQPAKAEHVRARISAPNEEARHRRTTVSHRTGNRSAVASMEKQARNSAARMMMFWYPLGMLLQQQAFLASIASSIMRSQQLWMRKLGR